MFEAMQMEMDGKVTRSFKIRMGYFKTKQAAIAYAKKNVSPNAIPYVMEQGKGCVWSPMHDKLACSDYLLTN